MKSRIEAHSFHIPVMGIGFTIDTPIKAGPFGISSVISLVDDLLMEKIRAFYSKKLNLPFEAISHKTEDFRAKRITAYLNLMDKILKERFEALKNSRWIKGGDLEKYLEMLPDSSTLKQKYKQSLQNNSLSSGIKWIRDHLQIGSIDVNIMTKLDKVNYSGDVRLPVEFNNSHAALRGFAQSNLNSSVVLSAGIHPRLYSYIAHFDDFYPDPAGQIKKRITLKVSDYKSAVIQGKFLAKKGLWISEYRIESGLNCGGHAFATQGYLIGLILEEFKNNREELFQSTYETFIEALKMKNRPYPENRPEVKVTAQGGIGTAEEHQFIKEYYQLDSVGWGTPFLLVPEVTNVDSRTRELLMDATEEDLYLSNTSPLGIPFNTLRGNTKDIEKQRHIDRGYPGSACSKNLGSFNSEFTIKEICTGSRQYQALKLSELNTRKLPQEFHEQEYNKIIEKSCICVGLGTSALLFNDLDTKTEGNGVSVCPGPNMAYFSKTVSLKEMTDHIYGRKNIIQRKDRPHVFLKELSLYIDYLKRNTEDIYEPVNDQKTEYFQTFRNNLIEGIVYYKELYSKVKSQIEYKKNTFLNELNVMESRLNMIVIR